MMIFLYFCIHIHTPCKLKIQTVGGMHLTAFPKKRGGFKKLHVRLGCEVYHASGVETQP